MRSSLPIIPLDAACSCLTVVRAKREAYVEDGYFREGWHHVSAAWGAEVFDMLERVALILFKPEALATSRDLAVPAILGEFDMAVAATALVCYDSRLLQSIWHYNISVATIDRLVIQTRYACPSRSYLLAVVGRRGQVPVSVRLKRLKGSASSAPASATLRGRLGSPNGLLNFLHTSEEPADFVRELAISLPWAERQRVLNALKLALTGTEPALKPSTPKVPRRKMQLELNRAVRRLADKLGVASEGDDQLRARREAVLHYVKAARNGQAQFRAEEFAAHLEGFSLPEPDLDLYVLCTYLIPFNREGRAPLATEDDLAVWEHRT
ncbi:MAG: hypothetical protein V4864_09430 [Pseudomonadota bacterium]